MRSSILVKVEKEVQSAGKKFFVKEYITKEYVYTSTDNGDIIFLKKNNNLYNVCHENFSLKIIDLSTKKIQLEKTKSALPDFNTVYTQKKSDYRKCTIEGRNINAVLNVNISIKKIPELSNTCYLESYMFSQASNLFSIKIDTSELIYDMDFNLNIQGNLNMSNVKSNNIEFVTDSKLLHRYDEISKYHIDNKLDSIH